MNIALSMTACRRPEIMERTVRSFGRYMPELIKATAIVNIDPAGGDFGDGETCAHIIRSSFRLQRYFQPHAPSFAKAFIKVWSVASVADYVFHLEDDWELLRPVSLDRMVEVLEAEPDLAVLRLPWKAAGDTAAKQWKVWFPWNGTYFECPPNARREVGFCGHPSLIRGEFVRQAVNVLDPSSNPEKQFHHGPAAEIVDQWRFGVWGPPNSGPAVKDIGREWMVKNGYKKAGNKAFFDTWERV
jgi:hypothetical protein